MSILASFCLLVSMHVAGQQTRISLKDKVSGKPVVYANVIAEYLPPLKLKKKTLAAISNDKGVVEFDISSPVKISTSFIGYNTAIDTLYPGKNLVIQLIPMVYNVDEVVVTGQMTPERVDKSIYKVKVLSSLSIDQKAALNLSDMLSSELNIRSSHDNIFGSSITMQGLGGEHVKFLIDGVPIIGRQNGELDLQQINMLDVDHLEIIQGPMSVIYGSNALAGVINIITKSPDRQKVNAFAELYTESVGVYNVQAGGSISKKKNSFSFTGARNFFGGFSVVDTSRFKQWKPKLQYSADAAYLYKTRKTSVNISGKYFLQQMRDKGLPSPIFNLDKAFDKYYFTTRWTTRGELYRKTSEHGLLKIMAAYSFYQKIKNTYIKDLTNLEKTIYIGSDSQDTSRFDNMLFRPVFSNSINKGIIKYQMGLDMNRETGSGKRVDNGQQEISDYAAFFSLAYSPVSQLTIQPGIRGIYNSIYKAPLVYSLNVKWNVIENLALRASVAKGFRAPSLKELYLFFVDINHNIIGNPDLKAENSENYSLHLTYNTHTPANYNWGIDMNLFYNHLENKIQLQNISNKPLIYSYVNVDQYYTQGVDINFNNRIYPWMKIVLGYAFTGRKQVSSTLLDNKGFIYSSDITAQTNVTWRKTGLNFSVFYKYNGKYPELTLDSTGHQIIASIAPYQTLDFNISRKFWKDRLTFQIGAKNLFNNTNVKTNGFTGGGSVHSSGASGDVPVNWGRTYFIKLQFNMIK